MATQKAFIGNIKGPQGEKGETGAQGPQGVTGETGKRGSRWSTGTAITGTSTTETVFPDSGISDALVNDQYLNTTTGNTYRCTSPGAADEAKWVFTGNLKGPQGEKGETGAQGPTGATGSQGAKGEKGETGESGTADTAFTQASILENIISGEAFKVILGKIAKVIDTVINLGKKVGDTDISTIGDGTVTGGISELNNALYPKSKLLPISGDFSFDENGECPIVYSRELAHQYTAILSAGAEYVRLKNATTTGATLVCEELSNTNRYISALIFCVY